MPVEVSGSLGRECGRHCIRMGDLGQGFQGHVSAADGPLVVALGEDRADQADDGVLVGKDADDIGPALDLLVEPLQGIGRVDLGSGGPWGRL